MAVVSVGVASAPFKCISRTPFSFSNTSNKDSLCRYSFSCCPRSDLFSKSCSQLPSFKKIFRLQQQQQHQHQQFVASASAGHEMYQPFRPPPSPSPALESVSIEEQLEILRERRGLWFDYAVHVPALIRAGFTPSMIDEATGMTGVEQNKIVVASQVRSSLQTSDMDEATLSCFDIVGADLLYELRTLSGRQRKSAAEFVLERKMDTNDCRDLARAMKDYERRSKEEGWNSFCFTPGDCLAFLCYRQSKEVKNLSERESTLKKGLKYADSEKARAKLSSFLEKGDDEVDEKKLLSQLQVVRLTAGEAGTTSMPYVLPVVGPTVQEIEAAPAATIRKGPFRIQHSEIPWNSWVSLPGWRSLTNSVAPFAIAYPNANLLPWKPKTRNELEEPVLLVADKHLAELDADTYFIVAAEGGKVGLQLGTVVSETHSKALGRVVLALRPPLPESEEIGIEDDD